MSSVSNKLRMNVKAKVEAIIYATEEPVTLNQLVSLLKNATMAELRAEEAGRLALNETVFQGKPGSDDDLLCDLDLKALISARKRYVVCKYGVEPHQFCDNA